VSSYEKSLSCILATDITPDQKGERDSRDHEENQEYKDEAEITFWE